MALEAVVISSQVAYGHVGNSAVVPALQALGIEAWAVPTVLYAHHPGHGPLGGDSLSGAALGELLDGLERRGVPARAAGAMTGYLREAAQAEMVAARLAAWRDAGFAGLVLCDPVLGDDATGLYVPEAAARAVRDRLVPLAQVLTPNRFELGWLAGRPVETVADARAAAAALIADGVETVVCTSAPDADALAAVTLAFDATGAWQARTPRLATRLHGAGDLLAGLIFGSMLLGRPLEAALAHAVSAVHGALETSIAAGGDELALVDALERLRAPGRMFEAALLD